MNSRQLDVQGFIDYINDKIIRRTLLYQWHVDMCHKCVQHHACPINTYISFQHVTTQAESFAAPELCKYCLSSANYCLLQFVSCRIFKAGEVLRIEPFIQICWDNHCHYNSVTCPVKSNLNGIHTPFTLIVHLLKNKSGTFLIRLSRGYIFV